MTWLRSFFGILSCLRTLIACLLPHVLLAWGSWVGAVLAVASSITIPILGATMVVRNPSIVVVTSMVMLKVSSDFGVKRGF